MGVRTGMIFREMTASQERSYRKCSWRSTSNPAYPALRAAGSTLDWAHPTIGLLGSH